MDCKVYAFYRTCRSVVMEPGERIPLDKWAGRVMQIFSRGDDVWQLHLDNPEDFDNIRKSFFSSEYWSGRTAADEYDEKTPNNAPKNIGGTTTPNLPSGEK